MALARNAIYNLMGAAVPAVVSVLTVPMIVHRLGVDEFGILAIVTAIVGYFGLLDINLTAGSTKFVAQFNAAGQREALHQTISFGLLIYLLIGLVGMAALMAFAHPLVVFVFNAPPDRQALAEAAVRVAGLGFLTGQVQAYLQSIPGALMRYEVSGRLEAVFGVAVPLGTVALLAAGFGLIEVVWLRVVASALQAALLVFLLRRLLPGFTLSWPGRDLRLGLLSFSGFAVLSRIAATTYAQADKLIIAAKTAAAQVAYFSIPATLANRVMALVFRLSGVMFPHASAMEARGQRDELARHYLLASRYLFYLNGALALLLGTLADPLLSAWVGAEFARHGAAVMALIALGQWIDAMTNLPSLVNDGLGHPRVTGLFALARAAVGLLFIFVGVSHWGIVGAAGAHALASLVMTVAFLLYVHGRTVPVPLPKLLLQAYAAPLATLLPLGAGTWLLGQLTAGHGWWGLLATLSAAALALLAGAWLFVVVPMHRAVLRGKLAALGRAAAG